MAHNPVGINSALPINASTSTRSVDTTAHKTDALRVVAVGAGAHVAIGTFLQQQYKIIMLQLVKKKLLL